MLALLLSAALAALPCGACTPDAHAYLDWVDSQPVIADHPEDAYHFGAQVHARLSRWAAERPGVVEPVRLGESGEGRPIWGFRMVDPGVQPVGKLLVFANIHAMEWVPTEVALAFGEAFAENPVRGVEVWLIPSLNVDGRARVEADLLAGKRVFRRGNAKQVDLNRDFTVHRESEAIWKAVIPNRYTVSPGPLSQPESQALDVLAGRERFDAAVSLHAFGGFFYYPWTGVWERAPDWQELHRLGRVMQAAMTKHPYKPRQLSRWGFFFRGLGMEIDHLYGRYGALSFLIETTRSGLNSPADLADPFRVYNPRDPAPAAEEGVSYLRALAVEVGQGRARRVVPPLGGTP